MGKVKGKHRLDKYYHLAKEHGYRSRAAWKLVQLDSKFSFLRSSRSVLDLCAAPGGWMQVAVERVPVGSLVIGIDLDPIRPIRGAIAVQEDITTTKCKSTVKKLMAENGCRAFDLILHDGSPNVGGAWAKEATSQNALVIDSVKLATELLAPKGTLVTKVFRSQDYSAVVYCLKQLFEKVEVDKPQASRAASAEIYVLAFRYKAPAKIDPRLLDFKHLFQAGKELPKVVDVLRGTKQKRHREGYEDGVSVLRKDSSAAAFVWSDAPLDILGSVTSISFKDPESSPLKDHSLTTEEVKALCDDLRVLGKQDFKYLLKWRMQLRKALSPAKVASASTAAEQEPKEDEDEDESVLNEMEKLTHAVERNKKRDKKIIAKRRAKDKARKALGIQQDVTQDGYTDQDLFSLTTIKGKKDLIAVDNNEFDDEVGDGGTSDDEGNNEKAQDYTSSDIDTEEERKRYDDQMEELLDEAYEQYVTRKEGSTKQRKRAKQTRENENLEESNDVDMIHPDQDSDNDQADRDANPLVVPLLEDKPTQEEIAAKWFSQDVFTEADDEILGAFESEDDMQADDGPADRPKKAIKNAPKEQVGGLKKNLQNAVPIVQSKAKEDFEIVPAPASDSSDSSSSDESDEDDPETRAEILAYAKKMLGKKQREEMLDDAYNKYMFHDDAGLPKWFLDEEKKHNQPMKPITKEEVNAIKAQFKEIDARPAKKVAQAKARKKRVTQIRLEKIRKKANSISDEADINDRSKRKMIDQLYKKAAPKKPEREYVVAKKGVQVRPSKGKVIVDRRMKKDTRARKASEKKSKGKKGKQKGKGSRPQTKANKRGSKAK